MSQLNNKHMYNVMDSVMNTINNGLRPLVSNPKIINIDIHKDGYKIATVQYDDGSLEVIMVKLLPKEMRDEFKGEVRNIYK